MPYDPPGFDLPPLLTEDDLAAEQARIQAVIDARTSTQAGIDAAQQASLDFLRAQVEALAAQGPGTLPPDLPVSTREPVPGMVLLDSFGGSTDDAKLTAAMSYCAAQTMRPKIGYGRRQHRLELARVPYTDFGFGPAYDRPNEQTRGGVPYEIKIAVPANAANPYGTWMRWPAGETHKVDISGRYEGSGLKSSLFDTDSGGVCWTSELHDICATNFQHILGNAGKKFLYTMSSLLTGHCNINNALGCSVRIGGSDGELFALDARSNIDGKPAAASAIADPNGRFHVWLDGVQKTDIFNAYVTAEGAWGAMRITGGAVDNLGSSSEVDLVGFLGEGRNAGAPCLGNVIVQEGSEVLYSRVKANYCTGPSAVLVKGGRATFDALGSLRANGVDESRPIVQRTGGDLIVRHMRRSGTWAGKPVVKGVLAEPVDQSFTNIA